MVIHVFVHDSSLFQSLAPAPGVHANMMSTGGVGLIVLLNPFSEGPNKLPNTAADPPFDK
jgi:hypothetical protein